MVEIDWKGNTMLAWDHALRMQDCVVNLEAKNRCLQEQVEEAKSQLTLEQASFRDCDKFLVAAVRKSDRWKKALPAIVFALAYSDYGEPGVTVESCIERWERHFKPALQEEHSGDCTNQCHSCARCQAEDSIKMADELAHAAIEEA